MCPPNLFPQWKAKFESSTLPLFHLAKEIIHAQVSRRHHWRHIPYRLGRGGSSPDADLLMPETAGAGRRFSLLVATLFLWLLLALANRATAQEGAETVRLDGRAPFSVSSSETLGAEERARRVEQRLGVLVRALETVRKAAVEASGDQRVIAAELVDGETGLSSEKRGPIYLAP